MVVSIAVPQAIYLAHVFVPTRVVGGIPLFARTYGGWDVALGLMILGGILAVGVSALTQPTAESDPTRFAVTAGGIVVQTVHLALRWLEQRRGRSEPE
jgi:SSS family solute:Na+ symporter